MKIISDLKSARVDILTAINDKFKSVLELLNDAEHKKIYINGESKDICKHCDSLKKELSQKV